MSRIPEPEWLWCEGGDHSGPSERVTLIGDVRVAVVRYVTESMTDWPSQAVLAYAVERHPDPDCVACGARVIDGRPLWAECPSGDDVAIELHDQLCRIVASPTGRALLVEWSESLDALVEVVDALDGG